MLGILEIEGLSKYKDICLENNMSGKAFLLIKPEHYEILTIYDEKDKRVLK